MVLLKLAVCRKLGKVVFILVTSLMTLFKVPVMFPMLVDDVELNELN